MVTMPRVFGGSEDETVTLKQLVRVASEIAKERRYEIDVVTGELKSRQRANVEGELEECRGSGSRVVVHVHSSASTLDRTFYVGTHVTIAYGEETQIVERGAFAQHVAISRDRPGDRSNWSLLYKAEAEKQVSALRDEIRNIGKLAIRE